MELWKEMLCKILQQETMEINFPQISDINKLFELKCYKVLKEIKEIIENEDLDDKECFKKIEEIISVFEKNGSHCGSRHDFG